MSVSSISTKVIWSFSRYSKPAKEFVKKGTKKNNGCMYM